VQYPVCSLEDFLLLGIISDIAYAYQVAYHECVIYNVVFCFVNRYGLRGKELFSNIGKVMIQGGGTFGTFMAIGTGIRC